MAVSMDSIAKLPKSRKILILLAFAVVILGLYWYLLYRPQKAKLDGMRVELGKLNKELEESEDVKRNLAKFRKDDENLKRELTLALAQLPNKKEIPKLLRDISSLGKGSGLEFLLFKPKPEERVGTQPVGPGKVKTPTTGKGIPKEPQEFYARVPLELIMLGSYHNVATFFDKISKLDRIINILNFSMGDSEQIGGETVVKTSCLATTFRFIETEGKAKEEAKEEGSGKLPKPLRRK